MDGLANNLRQIADAMDAGDLPGALPDYLWLALMATVDEVIKHLEK